MSSLQGDKLIYERSEYGDPNFTIMVGDVATDWFLTCGQCPEQYDVFLGDKQIGYVRLRGGMLRAAYPDVYANYSWQECFDDIWKGCFDDDQERDFYLDLVAKHLYNEYLKSETVR